MKQLPLPVRVAAGLAVTAVDRARHLPEKLAELPVTVVSQALQLSMRVQQQMTELAIKGDDALASFRPVEETPGWARFDEDEAVEADSGRSAFDLVDDSDGRDSDLSDPAGPDPWTAEQEALADEHADGEFDSAGAVEESGTAEAAARDVAGTESAIVEADPEDADLAELDTTAQLDITAEPQASGESGAAGESVTISATGSAAESVAGDGPAALPNYSELSLPQLRARLRRLSEDDLAELVEYERAHADRPDYVGMLTRRIATLRARQ